MQSLLDIASANVGCNASIYSTESIAGLPLSALEGVLPYLSAAELHKISDRLIYSGLQLNKLWKQHVITRWKRIQPVLNVFMDQEQDTDYHKVYLAKHFMELLNFCAVEESKVDPSSIFMSPLFKLKKPPTFMPSSSGPSRTHKHIGELINFAKYGYIIKIYGTVHCKYIWNNQELLNILLTVTKIIQIHHISDSNYNFVRHFLKTFLTKGNIIKAIFSSVKLSSEYLLDFMQICAGIECKTNLKECVNCGCSNLIVPHLNENTPSCLTEETPSLPVGQIVVAEQNTNPDFSEMNSTDNTVFRGLLDNCQKASSFKDEIENDTIEMEDNSFSIEFEDEDVPMDESEYEASVMDIPHFDDVDLFNEAVQPLPREISKDNCTSLLKAGISDEANLDQNSVCSNCAKSFFESEHHSSTIDPLNSTHKSTDDDNDSSQSMKSPLSSNSQRFRHKGLSSFVLLSSSLVNSSVSNDMSKAMVEVLPCWTSLKQLGFFDTDTSSENFTTVLLDKLEQHQLTHLVLDDVRLHEDFFGKVLEVLQKCYRCDEMDNKPLEFIDLQANSNTLTVPDSLHIKDPQAAVRKLDLSMNTLSDAAVNALLDFIRCDRALVHLKINGCFLKEDQVVGLLQSLRERNQIELLGLSGNRVVEEAAEAELIKFLTSVKSLKHISLNYCRLRSQFGA